jgi:hypothetical protein
VQVAELQHQLAQAVDAGQAHFNQTARLRTRAQHNKAAVAARLLGFWAHISASAAFQGWAMQADAARREQLLARAREETEALRAVASQSARDAAEARAEAERLRAAGNLMAVPPRPSTTADLGSSPGYEASPVSPLKGTTPPPAIAPLASVAPLRPLHQGGDGRPLPPPQGGGAQSYALAPAWAPGGRGDHLSGYAYPGDDARGGSLTPPPPAWSQSYAAAPAQALAPIGELAPDELML